MAVIYRMDANKHHEMSTDVEVSLWYIFIHVSFYMSLGQALFALLVLTKGL